jgi:hypothetical protein
MFREYFSETKTYILVSGQSTSKKSKVPGEKAENEQQQTIKTEGCPKNAEPSCSISGKSHM